MAEERCPAAAVCQWTLGFCLSFSISSCKWVQTFSHFSLLPTATPKVTLRHSKLVWHNTCFSIVSPGQEYKSGMAEQSLKSTAPLSINSCICRLTSGSVETSFHLYSHVWVFQALIPWQVGLYIGILLTRKKEPRLEATVLSIHLLGNNSPFFLLQSTHWSELGQSTFRERVIQGIEIWKSLSQKSAPLPQWYAPTVCACLQSRLLPGVSDYRGSPPWKTHRIFAPQYIP